MKFKVVENGQGFAFIGFVENSRLQTQFLDLRSLAHEQMRKGEFSSAKAALADMLSLEPDAIEAMCDLASCHYMTYCFDDFQILIEKAYATYTKSGVSELESDRQVSIILKLGKYLEEIGLIDRTLKIYKTQYQVVTEDDRVKHVKILSQKLRLACDFEQKNEILSLYRSLESIPLLGLDSDIDRFHALIKADGLLVGPTMAIQKCMHILERHTQMPMEHKEWICFDLIFDLMRANRVIPTIEKILQLFSYDHVGPFEKMVWDIYRAHMRSDENFVLDSSRIVGLNITSSIKIIDTVIFLGLCNSQKEELSNKMQMQLNSLGQESRKVMLDILLSPIHLSEKDFKISLTKNEVSLLEIFRTSQENVIDIEKICMTLYDGSADLHAVSRLKVSLSRLNKKLFVRTGLAQTFGFRNGTLVLLENSEIFWRKIS